MCKGNAPLFSEDVHKVNVMYLELCSGSMLSKNGFLTKDFILFDQIATKNHEKPFDIEMTGALH